MQRKTLMSIQDRQDERGLLGKISSLVIMLFAILAAAFIMRTFIFQSYEIPSGSMEDTIMTGDLVFAEKVSYNFSEPSRGQIVTFEDPEVPSRILIKRVIATGGQTIDLKNGNVYIDNVKIDEPYTDGKPTYPLTSARGTKLTYPYQVPMGEIWVMGDNRTASQDSRYFGSVPIKTVQGHAVFKYWPISSIGLL